MEQLQFECRLCKKKTTQSIVRITDLLPYGTETIQCHKCGSMTVALIGDANANL
jgi:Zn finger protein HypA/HybF involved in hydrogenase expression